MGALIHHSGGGCCSRKRRQIQSAHPLGGTCDPDVVKRTSRRGVEFDGGVALLFFGSFVSSSSLTLHYLTSVNPPIALGVPLRTPTRNEEETGYPQPVDKLGLFCQLFFSAEPVSGASQLPLS